MTIKEYQDRAYIAIQPHTDQKDEILNWAIGLAEECGEVMNHIKHNYWGAEKIDPVEISKEIGDVLWYSSALATVLNLNLDTIAELNVRKLEHRFGGKFSKEQSQARHELEAKFKDTDEYKELLKKLIKKED